VAAGVLLAGVAQSALLLRALKRQDIRWRWLWRVNWQPVRRMGKMMGPMVLGLGAFQIGAWLDSQIILMLSGQAGRHFSLLGVQIAYPLEEGSLAALTWARRLYNLPLGVLAIALATAAFPAFSRHAAAGQMRQLGKAVNQAMRVAIFEGLASGAAILVLAPLIVAVLFQRGRFDQYDTAQTAHVLRLYSIGLWAYCVQPIILRAFYSLQDTITPLRVTCATLLVNLLLNLTLLWVPALNVGAFGLSLSITATLNVLILGGILSRRLGGLGVGQLWDSLWRAAGACALMAGACWLTVEYLSGSLNRYLLLSAAVAAGVLTLAAACRLLGSRELGELLAGWSRRDKTASAPP